MKYYYRCPCGELGDTIRADNIICAEGHLAKRIWGFRVAAPFQAHFSTATGQWVNNKRELFDQGQRGAEEMNNRLGINTNYQIVDTHEIAGLGVTPEVVPQVAEKYGTAAANKLAKEYQIST